MKNYLEIYGKKNVTKHQEGGAVADPNAQAAAQGGAPAEPTAPEGGDLQTMLMQAYQSQDPQMALQVVNMIVEQMQQGAQGGVPAARNGMKIKTPVFKKGGVLKA